MKRLITKLALFGLTVCLTACGSQTQLQQSIMDTPSISAQSAPSEIGSFFRFNVQNPEVQNYIKTKGYDKKGYQISISKADLVYSVDNWQHTLTSAKQYLIDNTEGFILRGIAPNTNISYAVHANLCLSYDHFRSCESQDEFWVNNQGRNYQAKTTEK